MKLLILDRDGVVNEESDDFIKNPDEWHAIPGSLAAIARASHAGYRIVIVSNQSGLARGLFSLDAMHAIHQKLHDEVAAAGGLIDAIFFCPHGPDAKCDCRKPNAGLLREIGTRLHVSLNNVPVVGDRLIDVEAARKVEAQPILVRTGKGKTLDPAAIAGVPVFADLGEVVDYLLIPASGSNK